MYFWYYGFRGELGFPNCDDVCMCVFLTFTAGSVYLCGVSSPVVVLGLFVRLS